MKKTFNADETLNTVAEKMNVLLSETRYSDINTINQYVAIKDKESHKIVYTLYIKQSSVTISININALNYFRREFYDFCKSCNCNNNIKKVEQKLIVSYDNLTLIINEIERSFVLYSIEKMSDKARLEYFSNLNETMIAEIEKEIKSAERKAKRKKSA